MKQGITNKENKQAALIEGSVAKRYCSNIKEKENFIINTKKSTTTAD